ncbi:hypothetical protein [[Mycobacterium] nativiensis]|uniref:MerR family transcriptional regulator n=1 Tax=[Mycobacterium] nativiensis TaxID=2855503 RepID=A0ABU5XUT8_9MYCO|nr:hypothetical protein [Mycolicibacter sp. MYC340]MEB3031756.1 hypothetical protein [Mycolicibacter sp. MYC340]
MPPPSAWLSEEEIAWRTGLAGNLIRRLVPLPALPPGIEYDGARRLYPTESMLVAEIIAAMLAKQVHLVYVRAVVKHLRTPEQIEEAAAVWVPDRVTVPGVIRFEGCVRPARRSHLERRASVANR